jgi:23S rRNA pseudouridine1911/1915/1917 synthase
MLEILYEDNHCLALNKPAGLLTQGDATGAPSLIEAARADLKTRYGKPGNVFLGMVHRLDQPTSGVIVFARTSKAAGRLSAQFRAGTVEKVYWAVVEGVCPQDEGEWTDWLWKDQERNVVRVVPAGSDGAREALVRFRVLEREARTTTLELRPVTGRSHQLRVQVASRGLPILGDRKYGASRQIMALDGHPRVGLHARRIAFTHPTRPEVIEVVAPVPADWPVSVPGSTGTSDSSRPPESPSP